MTEINVKRRIPNTVNGWYNALTVYDHSHSENGDKFVVGVVSSKNGHHASEELTKEELKALALSVLELIEDAEVLDEE